MSENPWEPLAIVIGGVLPIIFVGGTIIAQELKKSGKGGSIPKEACGWLTDVVDDSMKELFESLTLYELGMDREDQPLIDRAVSHLRRQKVRAYEIWREAIARGAPEKLFDRVKLTDLQNDIDKIANAMERKIDSVDIAELVSDVDGKWTIPSWEIYHKCRSIR